MHAGTSQAVKPGGRARRSITRRRAVMVLCGAVLVAAAGSILLWPRPPDTVRAMRLMVRAFGEQRPVEGRLAGGFKGGRFVPHREEESLLQSQEIIDASQLIDKALKRNEAGAQLIFARLLLLTGETGPATLKAFRQAVEAEPSSAAQNDLGVCLLARNQLDEALDAFDAALQQQAEMPEALFNRALCYQQLQLRDGAGTDFARLLEVERDPSWQEEIRQHHEAVSAAVSPQNEPTEIAGAYEKALAAQDIDEARRIANENVDWCFKYACEEQYPEFLKATIEGAGESGQRELTKIEVIGEGLAARYGDKSLLDLVRHARSLTREQAGVEFGLIRQYLDVAKYLTPRPASEGQAILQAIKAQLSARGNVYFEYTASFIDANLDYNNNQFQAAKVKLQETLAFIESRDWAFQHAFVLAQMGNTCARLGQDSLALNYSKQAMAKGQGSVDVAAKAHQVMANACWHLGNSQEGLRHLRESTRLYSTKGSDFQNLASNTLQAADFYRLLGNHKLALLYARQTLGYAEAEGIFSRIAQATSFIAVELAHLNQTADSQAELRRAFAMIEKLSAQRRTYTQLLVLQRAGDIAAQQGDLQEAERHYVTALRIAETSQEKPLPLIKILKARAASYARAGQPEHAHADLERAIALIEEYRNNIAEGSNRSDFFDASQDVFDQMIQLKVRAYGQGIDAFNTSEQARARTLLDDLSPTAGGMAKNQTAASPRAAAPLRLEAIRAELPEDLTLISYSVTSGGTFIFVVTRKDFVFAESAATTERLDRLVQEYVEAMQRRAPIEELAEQSRQLYQLLIAPVESKIGAAKRLCIAPDKALHRLPFAALLDAADHYLLQSHILMSAPSASTLAYCLKAARAKPPLVDENLLAVGNPQFNREHFPSLDALPEAEREALESAALYYPHSRTLTGPQATKPRVLAELTDCDVAQFSTHCLVEEKTPELASLVLAQMNTTKDDELLRLNEFNKISLLRARLVILSACQSGLGQYYRGEGIVSLVRPFLARGVPTVIASLWPVDSQATAVLMIDFHKARKKTGFPIADALALRAAQLQMMQSAMLNHPYYWAPFVVIGSSN